MAFADPQSLTINAVPISLPRVSTGVNTSTYASNDGLVKQTVAHAYGKRIRRSFRVDHSKVAPDPLISNVNIKHSMSAQFILDVPITGYTVTELKQIADGLIAALSATSGSKITALAGGEN